jgi:Ca2+-binding RTX toxin-like protein
MMTVYNGNANDNVFQFSTLADSEVYGYDGNDAVFGFRTTAPGPSLQVFRSTIDLGNGNDTIEARRIDDSNIKMGSGTDTVSSLVVNRSRIDTGIGNDRVVINNGTEVGRNIGVFAGDGTDTIDAGKAIYNGAGQFQYGTLDSAGLYGEAGNDLIRAKGASNTTLDGGIGDDRLSVVEGFKVTMQGDAGRDNITFQNVSQSFVYAGNDADAVISTRGADNNYYLGAGNDRITLINERNANVYGEAGNDTLIENSNEQSTLYGGADNDTYIFRGNAGNDFVKDTQGQNRLVFESAVRNDPTVWFQKQGSTVLTVNHGTTATVTIDTDSTRSNLSGAILADGKQISNAKINQIVQLIQQYDASNNNVTFNSVADVQNNAQVMQLIAQAYAS